jgi:hypothetical protein
MLVVVVPPIDHHGQPIVFASYLLLSLRCLALLGPRLLKEEVKTRGSIHACSRCHPFFLAEHTYRGEYVSGDEANLATKDYPYQNSISTLPPR